MRQLPIAVRQSLSQAIKSVESTQQRYQRLTSHEQAYTLKQLAILEGITHTLIRQLVRRE